MAHTAGHVCLFGAIIGRSQKKEKKSQKCLERYGASSGHIKELEQSIFLGYLCKNGKYLQTSYTFQLKSNICFFFVS
jgi:hypothetical protein